MLITNSRQMSGKNLETFIQFYATAIKSMTNELLWLKGVESENQSVLGN